MRARAGTSPTSAAPLAALLAALLLLVGCELFSTKDFSPKPTEVRPFSQAFSRLDTVAFRITESLADPDSDLPGMELARRILRFAKAPDSQQTLPGWTALSLSVTSDPAGAYFDRSLVYMRFDSAGLLLKAPDSSTAGSGGARYFPLKTAVGGNLVGSTGAANLAADTAEFLVLPTAFQPGAEWIRSMGVLEVARALEEVDTLDYDGHLEESWRVTETVRGGGRTLSRGTFWYGASGLLRAEQTWDFEGRAADGSASAPKEIRRALERL